MALRMRGQARTLRVVEQALVARDASPAAQASAAASPTEPTGRLAALAQGADTFGKRLSEGRLAEALLPDEDNKLIELAGHRNVARARARYVVLRFGLAVLLHCWCAERGWGRDRKSTSLTSSQ